MFDLETLETFVAVAKSGGISPAARRLGLDKSIVSRRLIRLEETLGVQLLARTTRGASLTEAGLTFCEHAGRAVLELEAARDAISPGGELRGVLRIAAPLSFGPTHLAPIFAELARRHPRLEMHVSFSDAIVDIVSEGYDAAVRIGHLTDSTLVARRITSFRAHLVASPEYIAARGAPSSLDEIVDHEALVLRPVWPMTDRGQTVFVRPQGRFRADNGMAITAATLHGLGIALLPDFLVSELISSGALVVLLPEHAPAPVPIHLVRPPGANVPRKMSSLIDILLERIGSAVT